MQFQTMAAPALALAASVILAGCAAPPTPQGWKDPETCRENFRDYENAERQFLPSYDDPFDGNATVNRYARRIVTDGCLTRMPDIAVPRHPDARMAQQRSAPAGASTRPTAVLAGFVDGFAAQAQVSQYFALRGYRSRSEGAEGVGRKIYIGPFTSEGAI